MRIISLIGCAFLLASVHGQERFSKEEVMEDYQVFRAALEQAHPSLHTYYSPSQVAGFFDRAERRLSYSATGHTLYKTLLECISSIRDGHTNIGFPRSWNAYMGMNQLIPCHFVIQKGHVFIEKDLSKSGRIPPGSELLAINGIDIISLQKRLYARTPCDGNVQGFKSAFNSLFFSKRLAYIFPALRSYELELRTPSGKEITTKVSGISEQKLYGETSNLAFDHKLNEEQSTALLTIGSFELNGNGSEDFYGSLEELFKQIRKKKVERLVIDLRGNPGGDNDLAIALYSYISRGPFTYLGEGRTSFDPNALFAQHAEVNPARTFLQNGGSTDKAELASKEHESVHNGTHIMVHPENEEVDISKNKFAGEVIVLTDPLTRSAASIFAAVCKARDRAMIVGEGTGTACDSFSGGGSIHVTLPNSKLVLTIPYMQNSLVEGECSGFGRELRPDQEIIPSVDDLVIGRDPVLESLSR